MEVEEAWPDELKAGAGERSAKLEHNSDICDQHCDTHGDKVD